MKILTLNKEMNIKDVNLLFFKMSFTHDIWIPKGERCYHDPNNNQMLSCIGMCGNQATNFRGQHQCGWEWIPLGKEA
jgi:hypothetical protein